MAYWVILTSPTILGNVSQGSKTLGPFETAQQACAAANAATKYRPGNSVHWDAEIIGNPDKPKEV